MEILSKKQRIIIVDSDMVLYPWDTVMKECLLEVIPELVWIPTHQKKFWELSENHPLEYKDTIRKYCLNPPRNFYKKAEMSMENSLTGMKYLSEIGQIIICTSPTYKKLLIPEFLDGAKNSLEIWNRISVEKSFWLTKFFDNLFYKIIFTEDKTSVGGDIIIDDNPSLGFALENHPWQKILFDDFYQYNIGTNQLTANWEEIPNLVEDIFCGKNVKPHSMHKFRIIGG